MDKNINPTYFDVRKFDHHRSYDIIIAQKDDNVILLYMVFITIINDECQITINADEKSDINFKVEYDDIRHLNSIGCFHYVKIISKILEKRSRLGMFLLVK